MHAYSIAFFEAYKLVMDRALEPGFVKNAHMTERLQNSSLSLYITGSNL